MQIQRILNLPELLHKKSHFLFGPRQVGKSTLIRETLPNSIVINLLNSEVFFELSAKPSLLRQRALPGSQIIIDEIQKLPILLDEVQWLIEEKKVKFLLTGSSSRKLKRTGINLLGGRARSRYLMPFCSAELKGHFDLDRALNAGLFPSIYFSDDYEEDLKSYVGEYLTQEIAVEAAVRNLPAFSRFLQVASHYNSKQVNIEKLAQDAQVAPSTVRNHFEILKDTMLGVILPAWKKKPKTSEVAKGKFYFCDTGIARRLQGRKSLSQGTPEYGDALEAFIFHELRCYQEYKLRDGTLNFWRTHTGLEVDFIFNDSIAIEVKASSTISFSDLKGLKAFAAEYTVKKQIVVSRELVPRIVDNIEILPVEIFLEQLWSGGFD